MAKEKLCIYCNGKIHKKALVCHHCKKEQHKPIECKWCREKVPYDTLQCPYCQRRLDVPIPKHENNIFKRFFKLFPRPKNFNATVCWIFSLAAILSISCWIIMGKDGLDVGAFIGGGFAFIGFFIYLIMLVND